MRSFVKPLIPLNAAKLRIIPHSYKYFLIFLYFSHFHPIELSSFEGRGELAVDFILSRTSLLRGVYHRLSREYSIQAASRKSHSPHSQRHGAEPYRL